MTVPMSEQTRLFLRLGRLGFFGLFILMPLWVVVFAPPSMGSTTTLLVLLWGPLFLPLWGIIQGKAYTFAWANFIVMWYFVHSTTNLWVGEGIVVWLALFEFGLACLMFYGCTYYARNRGKELGLKIPKLKDDPVGKPRG